MHWWELTITLEDAYRAFISAEGAYLRRLDATGNVAVRAMGGLCMVQAVSCYRPPLLPLAHRALHGWPAAQITLLKRHYHAPPCPVTWEKLYGDTPALAERA